jgi:hypothetical protein
MEASKIFSAAVVAMTMFAVGSTVTSCSEDQSDPVGHQYQSESQQQGVQKKATQARLVMQIEFGHETFKAYDVVLTYTDFDEKEHKESITQSNVTEGKGYWNPSRTHYYFKKEISTSKLPAKISYHVDMYTKAGVQLDRGELGIRNSACIYGLDSNGYAVSKALRPVGVLDKKFSFYDIDPTHNIENIRDSVYETSAFKSYLFEVTTDDGAKCNRYIQF